MKMSSDLAFGTNVVCYPMKHLKIEATFSANTYKTTNGYVSPIDVCSTIREMLSDTIERNIGREDSSIVVSYCGMDNEYVVLIKIFDLITDEINILRSCLHFDTITISNYGYLMLSEYNIKVNIDRG